MTDKSKSMGYIEIPHTADRMLKIWATDYRTLLVQALNGMYSLMEVQVSNEAKVIKEFSLNAFDRESLLILFLSEMLFYLEEENLVFFDVSIDINENNLLVKCKGSKITDITKSIKAVTYHNLKIIKVGSLLEVNIVFDC